jgi:hypothetical protein
MASEEVFVALAVYRTEAPHEISLAEGDVVEIINRDGDDWWFGRKGNGREVRVCGSRLLTL